MAITQLLNFILDFGQWFFNLFNGSLTTHFTLSVPTSWMAQAQGYMGWIGLVVNLPAVEAAFAFYSAFYLFVFGIATIVWIWRILAP